MCNIDYNMCIFNKYIYMNICIPCFITLYVCILYEYTHIQERWANIYMMKSCQPRKPEIILHELCYTFFLVKFMHVH